MLCGGKFRQKKILCEQKTAKYRWRWLLKFDSPGYEYFYFFAINSFQTHLREKRNTGMFAITARIVWCKFGIPCISQCAEKWKTIFAALPTLISLKIRIMFYRFPLLIPLRFKYEALICSHRLLIGSLTAALVSEHKDLLFSFKTSLFGDIFTTFLSWALARAS